MSFVNYYCCEKLNIRHVFILHKIFRDDVRNKSVGTRLWPYICYVRALCCIHKVATLLFVRWCSNGQVASCAITPWNAIVSYNYYESQMSVHTINYVATAINDSYVYIETTVSKQISRVIYSFEAAELVMGIINRCLLRIFGT